MVLFRVDCTDLGKWVQYQGRDQNVVGQFEIYAEALKWKNLSLPQMQY